MARKREIHFGFFQNEYIAELSPLARLFLIGMWNLADREGRLEDRPKKLRAEILPYDSCDGEEFVSAIASKGFIIRYEVDGKRYIQINNWHKYQDIHPREAASTIPDPPSQGEPKANPGESLDCPVNPIPSFPSCTSFPSQNTSGVVNARGEMAPRDKQEKVTAEIFTVYQKEMGLMSDIIKDKLLDLIDHYPRDWIVNAIEIAVLNGKRKLSYVEGIINRWTANGYDLKSKPWEDEKHGKGKAKKQYQSGNYGRGQPGYESAGTSGTDWESEPDTLGG